MSPKLLTMLLAALLLLTSASLAESAPVTVMGRPEETISGPGYVYDLTAVHEVDGRQGVAWDNGFFISGSTTLTKYDVDWKLIAAAEEPFSGFTDEVNHLGDIDVYNGEIYAGVEYFMDGEAKNIQIAVYDAQTRPALLWTLTASQYGCAPGQTARADGIYTGTIWRQAITLASSTSRHRHSGFRASPIGMAGST